MLGSLYNFYIFSPEGFWLFEGGIFGRGRFALNFQFFFLRGSLLTFFRGREILRSISPGGFNLLEGAFLRRYDLFRFFCVVFYKWEGNFVRNFFRSVSIFRKGRFSGRENCTEHSTFQLILKGRGKFFMELYLCFFLGGGFSIYLFTFSARGSFCFPSFFGRGGICFSSSQ